jgi:hypothetical protein
LPDHRTRGRLSNVTIVGGGAFVGATSHPQRATRKGLGIVKTVASPSWTRRTTTRCRSRPKITIRSTR